MANVKFDSDSRVSLSNADSGANNTVFGKLAGNLLASGDTQNVFIGENVADADMTNAVNNTGVGYNSLGALTSGENNVAIGHNALDANESGDLNVAVGKDALGAFIGSASIAIGREALRDLNHASAADGTIAIGTGAGASLTSGAANVAIGYQALDAEDVGNYSTAVGYQALTAQSTTHADPVTNTDSGNTAVGFKAGFAVSTGIYNTIMGRTAGFAINSGASNTVMGSEAGKAMTTTGATVLIGKSAGEAINSADADGTVAIGKDALKALTDGQNNIAIGHVAADVMTVSNRNVIIGAEAFTTAATATGQDDNIGIGYRALNSANVQDFNRNVAIGSYSMFSSGTNQQTGTVAIGYSALGDLTSGVRNTGVGYLSIYANTTGADNTALGYNSLAGVNHTDADHNTAVGVNGGSNLVTGYQNTFIGSNNQPASSSTTNSATLGYAVTAVASNSVTLGNASVTAVYAGSDSGAVVHCGGVNFPDSFSESADVNTLDDYEEGTYAVTLAPAAGSLSLHGSVNELGYTKIGDLCHIQGRLECNGTSSDSGATTISLPFTCKSLTDDAGGSTSVNLVYLNGDAITDGSFLTMSTIGEGLATCRIFFIDAGTSTTENLGDNHIDDGSSIYVDLHYKCA